MKNKVVLITGAEGFVGTHLIKFLLENSNYEIYAAFYAEVNNKTEDKRVKYIRMNISDGDNVINVIADIKPDYIYHLAGISFVPASFANPYLTYDTNLIGTLNIYEAVLKLKQLSSILFVSTSEVYGVVSEKEVPIKEERALKPQNPYAVSKAAAEMLSYQYYKNYGLNIKIARPFNHIGIGQNSNFAVPAFASQIADIVKSNKSDKIKVGNLDAIRDFLNVKDVLRAYKLIIESEFNGEIFNICSGEGVKIKDILDSLINISGRKIEIEFDDARMRPSENPIIIGDYSKIRTKLGWSPKIILDETLEEIYNSYL